MFEGQPKGLFALALANTGISYAGVFPPADWWYHGR